MALNFMGGEIKWAALDYMVERFGVEDVDLFVTQLDAIVKHTAAMQQRLRDAIR